MLYKFQLKWEFGAMNYYLKFSDDIIESNNNKKKKIQWKKSFKII